MQYGSMRFPASFFYGSYTIKECSVRCWINLFFSNAYKVSQRHCCWKYQVGDIEKFIVADRCGSLTQGVADRWKSTAEISDTFS